MLLFMLSFISDLKLLVGPTTFILLYCLVNVPSISCIDCVIHFEAKWKRQALNKSNAVPMLPTARHQLHKTFPPQKENPKEHGMVWEGRKGSCLPPRNSLSQNWHGERETFLPSGTILSLFGLPPPHFKKQFPQLLCAGNTGKLV